MILNKVYLNNISTEFSHILLQFQFILELAYKFDYATTRDASKHDPGNQWEPKLILIKMLFHSLVNNQCNLKTIINAINYIIVSEKKCLFIKVKITTNLILKSTVNKGMEIRLNHCNAITIHIKSKTKTFSLEKVT